MRKNGRRSKLHTYLFILLCMTLALLASAATFMRARASSPTSGSISATSGTPTSWVGDSLATGGTEGESNCIDSGAAKNCDQFTLTVNGNPSDWVGKLVQVRVAWNLQTDDYDLYVHKGTLSGPLAGSGSNGGQPGTEENAFLDPANSGTGVYVVHVAYATNVPGQDIYAGNPGRQRRSAISTSLSADQSDCRRQRH